MTFTPLKGMSGVVARYLLEESPDRQVVTMTIDDAGRYSRRIGRRLLPVTPRTSGRRGPRASLQMGAGHIFQCRKMTLSARRCKIPSHGRRSTVSTLDGITHSARCGAHGTAADDVFYVVGEYRQREASPIISTPASIKPWGDWIPVSWPHDGLQHDKAGGNQLAGLALRAEPAARARDVSTIAPMALERACLTECPADADGPVEGV